MNKEKTIMLTGAAGFIGSYLLGFLNRQGYRRIILADEFTDVDKVPNYGSKDFIAKIERKDLFDWLQQNQVPVDFVFHLGARTDTTEFDYSLHEKLNVEYSKNIWNYCMANNIPLVYASSAATYGSGELGYSDNHEVIFNLKPLNPYGVSKNEFDKWLIEQNRFARQVEGRLPFWAGLKFFNVYGPNEYHKARMASMIFHGYHQVQKTGKVKLFKSHQPEFKDGEQLRDFIYVEDVARVCFWLMQSIMDGQWSNDKNGLYNLGTGIARTFNDLEKSVFEAMDKEPSIEYINMPEDIRDKYQYFTEADISKLRLAGYTAPFYSLEQGVSDYIKNYLLPGRYY
jgi:ADP-L-glycero-D-manno-heptose 6-epimerase